MGRLQIMVLILSLIILVILFICINSIRDTYSLKSLIRYFELSRGDGLLYKYDIKQGLRRCRISGKFEQNKLYIDKVEGPKNAKHDLCPDVAKYTGYNFIGPNWPKDNPLTGQSIDMY